MFAIPTLPLKSDHPVNKKLQSITTKDTKSTKAGKRALRRLPQAEIFLISSNLIQDLVLSILSMLRVLRVLRGEFSCRKQIPSNYL